MRNLKMLTAIAIFLCSPALAGAAEPADSQIKGAMDDITRIESQFSGTTTPRESVINRTLKLLQLTRQRLDSSTNRTHESWLLADQRYKAIVKTLQSLLTKSGNESSATLATGAGNEEVKTSTDKPKTKSSEKTATMISQDRTRIKKLVRDIGSAAASLDQGGPKPFQDPVYVQKFASASAGFHQSLQKYAAFSQDPDVQQASAELQKLDGMILFGKDQAKSVLQELGDVQDRLANLQTLMRNRRPPATPNTPYTSDAISSWIEQAKLVRSSAVADFHQLEIIQTKAWLPLTRGTVEQGAAFDLQDVNRLMSGLQGDVKTIDDTLKQLEANLTVQVNGIGSTLEWFAALDPADSQTRENSFLGEGQETEAIQRLDRELQIAEAAIAFDKQLNRGTLPGRQSLLNTIQQAKTRYLAQRAKALQMARMPQPASTSTELQRIAKETLAKPGYGTGEILRLVINSDKVSREKETSEIELDEIDVRLSGDVKLSGTKTTTRYQWEQFQVATAEPVDGKYFIFYNTLKYFSAGATTTPLNRWLLSERLQGSEILKQNINLE